MTDTLEHLPIVVPQAENPASLKERLLKVNSVLGQILNNENIGRRIIPAGKVKTPEEEALHPSEITRIVDLVQGETRGHLEIKYYPPNARPRFIKHGTMILSWEDSGQNSLRYVRTTGNFPKGRWIFKKMVEETAEQLGGTRPQPNEQGKTGLTEEESVTEWEKWLPGLEEVLNKVRPSSAA